MDLDGEGACEMKAILILAAFHALAVIVTGFATAQRAEQTVDFPAPKIEDEKPAVRTFLLSRSRIEIHPDEHVLAYAFFGILFFFIAIVREVWFRHLDGAK
jgi:hypothetical protein